MIRIRGVYYDGLSSREVQASLEVYRNGEARLIGLTEPIVLSLSDLGISSRVGNTPRGIQFPRGGKFETEDNDAVDTLLARTHAQRGARLLHLLETNKIYILIAFIAVTVLAWGVVQHGIPAMAKHAAFALPVETNVLISDGTLDLLDKRMAPSELDAGLRARISRSFDALTRDLEPEFDYQLLFRKGRAFGANALALPSGTVIITDEMVKLARHEHEITAVLAHEVGHIVYRHGLRQAIQGSALALIVTVITGDVSASSSVLAAIPTMLIHARYSRTFEIEADRYALDYLRRRGIDRVHFANLMQRLEQQSGDASPPAYLSTHPPTAERVRLAEDTPRGKAP